MEQIGHLFLERWRALRSSPAVRLTLAAADGHVPLLPEELSVGTDGSASPDSSSRRAQLLVLASSA